MHALILGGRKQVVNDQAEGNCCRAQQTEQISLANYPRDYRASAFAVRQFASEWGIRKAGLVSGDVRNVCGSESRMIYKQEHAHDPTAGTK